jgi:hypothetical protein
MYLGVNVRNPGLQASIGKLKKHPPKTANLLFTYYATQVMHHAGGEHWKFWDKGPGGKDGIQDVLVARQAGAKSGDDAGTWEGGDLAVGRLGATAYAVLTLNVYLRHMPLYRRDSSVIGR